MAAVRVHVSSIARVAPPTVELQDGARVQLDPANPRTQALVPILKDLARLGRPVYLEVDPTTQLLFRLLIPQVVRVVELRATEDGGLDVILEPSAARHRLRPALPTFAQVEAELRAALAAGVAAVVTEDDAHDIIHVRLFDPGRDGPLPPLPPRRP